MDVGHCLSSLRISKRIRENHLSIRDRDTIEREFAGVNQNQDPDRGPDRGRGMYIDIDHDLTREIDTNRIRGHHRIVDRCREQVK